MKSLKYTLNFSTCCRFWRSAEISDSTKPEAGIAERTQGWCWEMVARETTYILEHLLGPALTVSHVVRNDFTNEKALH